MKFYLEYRIHELDKEPFRKEEIVVDSEKDAIELAKQRMQEAGCVVIAVKA